MQHDKQDNKQSFLLTSLPTDMVFHLLYVCDFPTFRILRRVNTLFYTQSQRLLRRFSVCPKIFRLSPTALLANWILHVMDNYWIEHFSYHIAAFEDGLLKRNKLVRPTIKEYTSVKKTIVTVGEPLVDVRLHFKVLAVHPELQSRKDQIVAMCKSKKYHLAKELGCYESWHLDSRCDSCLEYKKNQ